MLVGETGQEDLDQSPGGVHLSAEAPLALETARRQAKLALGAADHRCGMVSDGLGALLAHLDQLGQIGQAAEGTDAAVAQHQEPRAGAGGLLVEHDEAWHLHRGDS
jgi:hypothetical protein